MHSRARANGDTDSRGAAELPTDSTRGKIRTVSDGPPEKNSDEVHVQPLGSKAGVLMGTSTKLSVGNERTRPRERLQTVSRCAQRGKKNPFTVLSESEKPNQTTFTR